MRHLNSIHQHRRLTGILVVAALLGSSLVGGVSANGIKLNKATGALGGTPKLAGTYTVTIQLADTKTKTKPPVQHVTTATFIVTVS